MKLELRKLLAWLGLMRPAKIMYIGGSDVLPPPLAPAEEQRMLAALAQGDESAKRVLIEHNLRLVVYIARRFENTGINIEDLISIGTIGLIKAVGTFKPDRNIKLATYSSRCIENEILMYIRKISGQKAEVSLAAGARAASRAGDADRIHAFWPGRSQGAHAEGGCGADGNLTVVYLPSGKADHGAAEAGDHASDFLETAVSIRQSDGLHSDDRYDIILSVFHIDKRSQCNGG